MRARAGEGGQEGPQLDSEPRAAAARCAPGSLQQNTGEREQRPVAAGSTEGLNWLNAPLHQQRMVVRGRGGAARGHRETCRGCRNGLERHSTWCCRPSPVASCDRGAWGAGGQGAPECPSGLTETRGKERPVATH